MQWDTGTVSLRAAGGAEAGRLENITFGVFNTFMNRGGGTDVIIGLVKHKASHIRPTFLGQVSSPSQYVPSLPADPPRTPRKVGRTLRARARAPREASPLVIGSGERAARGVSP